MWRQHFGKVVVALIASTVLIVVAMLFTSSNNDLAFNQIPVIAGDAEEGDATVELTPLTCSNGVCLSPEIDDVSRVRVSSVLDLAMVAGLESVSVTSVDGAEPEPVSLTEDGVVDVSSLGEGTYMLTVSTDVGAYQVVLLVD